MLGPSGGPESRLPIIGICNRPAVNSSDHSRDLQRMHDYCVKQQRRKLIPPDTVIAMEQKTLPPALQQASNKQQRQREIAETPETSKWHVGVQLAGNNPCVAFVPSNVPLHGPSIIGMFDACPRLEKQLATVSCDRLGMHSRGERSRGQGQRMGEQCGTAKSGVV